MSMTRQALALTGVLVLSAIAAAQIQVDVRLVNVVATVTDSRGRYVPDLEASDFTLAEDGTRQEIAHFAHSNDLPVSVGIVLDTSGSMERKIATATRAVDRFLRDIHEDDDIFLMTFDQSVNVRQDFTSDRDKLWRALQNVRVGGGTSLYDAAVAGVSKMRKAKYPKKAILLISDGVDTESVRNYNDARGAIRESEVLVYALGIAPQGGFSQPSSVPGTIPGGIPTGRPGQRVPSIGIPLPGGGINIPLPGPRRNQFPGPVQTRPTPNEDTLDMDVLNTFADESGGKAWQITLDTRGRNRLQDALDEIADELRNQYSIGYYPGHDLKDGKWHRTELNTKNPNYHVRYKGDYLGK